MNTNVLKKFAQETRRKLMQQVAAKLEFVTTNDTPELREKAEQVKKLKEALQKHGKEQLIDKVAYTWFNRFMALRFMDANDYQPLGVRILSPLAGQTTPEILKQAKQGDIPSDLKVNHQKVMDLLDGRTPSSNPQNEAYKELLIASCNHLNTVLPFLFERINDYTELLLPDDLTSQFSVLTDMVAGMTEEDCHEVEIIGWLYQFYISEKKDEVFASKSKVKKEDIPAATQLFTPRWIVEYMVQNTLGKLWLQNKPNSKLREHMPYFIESPSLETEDYLKVSSPEEIKLLDQACGSGHILVYGFDLLTKIYEEEGYSQSEIAQLILTKNLFGFEIDERAAQLAAMALLMKARSYQRRLFKKEDVPAPTILCYQDLLLSMEEVKETLQKAGIKPSEELLHDLRNMQQATNLGSLILPYAHVSEINRTLGKVEQTNPSSDAFYQYQLNLLKDAMKQLQLLADNYHCVVDNPPYMGGGNMNAQLAEFVRINYPDSKADLMACFMEAGLKVLHPKGFLGMINQHSWMFLSSYEALRKKLIENSFFDTLLHLGPRTFPEIGGEVVQNAAFTLWNATADKKGVYLRLVDLDKTELKRNSTIEAIQNSNCGWYYTADQKDFVNIPGSPVGYWLSKIIVESFAKYKHIESYADAKKGMDTALNDYYLRLWHEVNKIEFGTNYRLRKNDIKWVPYRKGGVFRKWFGNHDFVLNWNNNGKSVKEFSKSNIRNEKFYFKKSISWTLISSSIGARYYPEGFIFDGNSPSLFFNDYDASNIPAYILGLLNSKVGNEYIRIISPTLAFNSGDIARIPINLEINSIIIKSASDSITISENEWDSHETSWDFAQNELVKHESSSLEESYDLYQQYWRNKFFQLHKNEEELNRQFIEIYGLQEELTPDVPLEEITILKEETSIENGQLVFHADEVFTQFVSYAVGCMFGRYSLDKEGLILANQGETLEDYWRKTDTERSRSDRFEPDADNIIPVLDDDWFEDDIVGRFYAFLKASFGEENFQKNLAFVEECLGKDMRKFFTKDFYDDHIKRYKKRPIYWMFSSPKGSFSVLVYMHRYTPDTLNNILNKYLREFIDKLKIRKEHLEQIKISGSAAEQSKAIKEIDKLDKMLLDCQEYEREILYNLATERIAIDLDDGVLVNYNKFGKAIKEVKGLNDAATKKKVKEFDWIDGSKIR
jgi:type II restriction/modification system DNA methylase subunit YeeA